MRSLSLPLILISVAVILLAAGCEDDLQPTKGTVQIELSSTSPGLVDGATFEVDGLAAPEAPEGDIIELHLDPGEHVIRAVPADSCVVTEPAEIAVTVEVGATSESHFMFLLASGISVSSNLDDLPILLDGEPTGETTPASLGCIPPGSHRVELELDCDRYGLDVVVPEDSSLAVDILVPNVNVEGNVPGIDIFVDGEPSGYQVPSRVTCIEEGPHSIGVGVNGEVLASQEIVVDSQALDVRLDIRKPIVLEVAGWVICPNCPTGDEATEALLESGEFDMFRLQIHKDLGGSAADIFGNEETAVRYNYYRGDVGAPIMIFNGREHIRGASDVDAVLAQLKEMARQEEQDNGTSWFLEIDNLQEVEPHNPEARGGEVYTVDVRVLVIGEFDDSIHVLHGFAYKTGIDYTNPREADQTRFYHVIRTTAGPIPVNEAPYELINIGDEVTIPLEFRFPTGEKFEVEQTPEPDFEGYGIVVLIQTVAEFPEGRIHQAAEIKWDRN